MNELLPQFILESRDLVEQASTALLVLEKTPSDAEARDALFRSMHTLKGGASIVDFAAMERAVHAAEDLLSVARANNAPVTIELIADCLACLDQIIRWLDAMQATGELPLHADEEAHQLLRRSRSFSVTTPAAPSLERHDWIERLLAHDQSLRGKAQAAVKFSPRSDSFFRGEDPLAILSTLPNLLAIDVEPLREVPPLESFDPFASVIAFTALTTSTADALRAFLKEYSADCEIVSLAAGAEASGLPQSARDILEAQLLLLDTAEGAAFVGIVSSARAAAANVLRYCDLADAAELVAAAAQRSMQERNVAPLRNAIVGAMSPPASQPSAPTEMQSADLVSRTLRVDAARVDGLVRLTGELTVVKNAIGHAALLAQADDNALTNELKSHYGVLDRITGELQQAVLAMRVLPLRNVMQRLPRIVREMSAALDKPARIVVEGDETEADKAIVEMLFEPLLHIVRNSMDHGIETRALRAQGGKDAVATIRLRASRQGEHVVIEVEDDGAGIDVERVRAVAATRGVAPVEALTAMSDAEVIDLIFAPGFSTATTVTELSGRGVGMDAVRKAVGSVGGRVAIDSRPGLGATVKFTLPFSVMMTHVMTVEAGGQMFGIPLDAVVETIRIPAASISGVGAGRAIVRRDRTIPVFDLASLLNVREISTREQLDAFIVIASFAGHLTGIQVDRPGERMEIMLKPLEGLLSGIRDITGTTILGDGRVLLVLDLDGILQ